MNELTIYNKINTLPDELKKEVIDFIDFIKSKKPVKRLLSTQKPAFLKEHLSLKKDLMSL
jgi:hypothetical protein